MEPPPPPPPPHGANQQGGKAGGLPDGKYDIFVIPPSSSGSGFLYLPSLNTHRNSFLAGVACTAAAFFIWNVTMPAVKDWLYNTMNGGGSGVIMLMLGVGVISWAFGKTQAEGAQGGSTGSGSAPGASGTSSSSQGQRHYQPPPQPGAGPQSPPKSSWQRPQANTSAGASGGKTSWEKAREETRKKEEEKRRAEELKKRREELEKEKQKQREKELRERLERELREKKAREDREAAAKAAKEKPTQSPPKRPPMPTARTEDDDDAYSFRPYDKPRRAHKANSAASMYSESSYASQTTARTTSPPSFSGPYSTKDPDKIIIRGVYSFTNAFMRTPVSQLVSGQGQVTDGLILRITTEGLFIDDDRRGVPQREWDVKAWTMKLAEVWCPNIPLTVKQSPRKVTNPFVTAASRQNVTPSESESSAFMSNFLQHCCSQCQHPRPRRNPVTPNDSASVRKDSAGTDDTLQQSCEMAGLHVLRASIRDQEGKKYVFILSQSEGWKVAVGLQRLRRGTQVRALGVAGLPQNEAKALLQQLGYV